MESATTAEQQDPRPEEEDLLKCNSHGHRNKGKNLLTFIRPQVCRDLQQDPLPPTANP